LAYLYRWVLVLVGRSGAGMSGILPLSHTEIKAWVDLHGHTIYPHEVDALLALDAALRMADDKPEHG
jgi:hypothetical protein